ncbi:MAG: glycosyltransferase, partial [Clostridium sp.]
LQSFKESQRYTKGLFSLIGHKKKEILFQRDPRAAGQTKWNYIKLCGLAIEGITSFTTAPLRISIFIGFLMSIFSFMYMSFIICKKIFLGIQVPGYPSLMSVILFIGGLQFLFLGIIGEYLGRVFLETKSRPLYFINEYKSRRNYE